MPLPKFKKKEKIIVLSIIVTTAIFAISFLIRSTNDNLFSVLSLAFTALGAIATFATFIVVILLYDKFGLEQKIVLKQTDKVFELIDLLKGKVITVNTKQFQYHLRPSIHQLSFLKSIPYFLEDSNKSILVKYDDYNLGTKEIMIIKRSYWLPQEIKDKMNFLDIYGINEVRKNKISGFAQLDMGTGLKGQIGSIFPDATFESFSDSLQALMISIETWLKKYSSISIDFKMEESEK